MHRYNVVHSHVRFLSGVILALAARADVPMRIAHFHSIGYGEHSTLLRRAQREALRWLIDRYATDIVACSEGIASANWRPTGTASHAVACCTTESTPEG